MPPRGNWELRLRRRGDFGKGGGRHGRHKKKKKKKKNILRAKGKFKKEGLPVGPNKVDLKRWIAISQKEGLDMGRTFPFYARLYSTESLQRLKLSQYGEI